MDGSLRLDTTVSAAKRRRKERVRKEREIPWPLEFYGAAPVVLTDRATSVTPAESLDYSTPDGWWSEIDAVWHERKDEAARSWRRRAAAAARAAVAAERLNDTWSAELGEEARPVDALAARKRAWYADGRARTLALDRSAVVESCGTRQLTMTCACGPVVRPVGCGQVLLCDRCRGQYYKRIRRRALSAVTARMADAMTVWHRDGRARGARPVVVLVTLTIPRALHGEPLSLAERQGRLVEGWRRLRQWLHRRIGQFAYVALPELTAGTDGSGHLHYHAVCVWPWWDWRDAQDEWRRATGLPDANPPDMRVIRNAKTAAHYVAKYATKGVSTNGPSMTAALVADFVATFYNKRRVIPSVGFWVPMDPPCCPRCSCGLVVTERPQRVSDAAAAWRAARALRSVSAATAPPDERPWLQLAPRW